MAIVQNPLIGQASGSAAGLTFQHYNGKNIIRRKPFTQTTQRTLSQIEQQDKFKGAIVRMIDQFPFLPDYIYPYSIRTRSKRSQLQIDMNDVGKKNNEIYGLTKDLGQIGNAKSICSFTPYVELVAGPFGIQRFIFSFSYNRPSVPSFYPHYFLTVVFNTTRNEFLVTIVQYLSELSTYDFLCPGTWLPFDCFIWAQMDLGKQTDISTDNSRLICQGYNPIL